MNILSWIIFGLIAGFAANLFHPRPNTTNILSAVFLGIAGAVTGGFLASIFFGLEISGFDPSTLLIAVLSSLFLLSVGSLLRKGGQRWN